MKIGDLVQLSSYGVKRGYNKSINYDLKQAGLVIEIVPGRSYPYRVKWSKLMNRKKRDWSNHSRLELKHARR
jgi:hypothetical protein